MSRSSTPAAPERDQQLLSIGHQCSAPTCNLVDFLPFKCQHCSQRYCGEHFLPKAHNCDKYDESKHNRVAPSCPMCSTPVAIPPGEDPNIRMERHITHECPVTTGKPSKAKSAPTCDRASCGKVLFAPIKCSKCTKQFCPQHRFPNTHNCPSIKTASGSQTSLGGSSTTSRTPTRPAAAGAAAMAAFKRSMASASSSTSSQAQTTRTSASSPAKAATSSIPNPFSKTDRRARDERQSQIKAMRERARRGLLSKEEQAILTALEEGKDEDGKECVVM